MDLSYILNELGEDRERHHGAVIPPVYQTSNFCFPTVAEMRETLVHEQDRAFYTRGHNPTVAILRQKLAALAGAEDCLVFGSGSGAIAAAVVSQVAQGDHVVCVRKPYSWTANLLNKLLGRMGVSTTYIPGEDPFEWEAAIQENTRLFILESPNTMTFEQQDIAAVAELARSRGIRTILDNSYATPLNQSPIALGIDITCHSGTKYLNGHSDVVAGVLCASRDLITQIFEGEFMTLGSILSPHDAALMIRGLRTLPIRLDRVAASTRQVIAYLDAHPQVARVYHPFSADYPQPELTARQLKAPGGLFSIELQAADIAACERFCNALERFKLACSWGGHESLVFPICTLYDSQNYSATTLPWNFMRFYVGLEEPEVLLADLERAFAAM